MKKISLLLVVLLAAGSAGLYGQMAIGTEFKISGDATATVGYNIDNEQFGFKNESGANITLELVAKNSVNNAEMVDMGGWVGSIELKDFKIIINSDEEDSHLRYTAVKADKDGSCPSGKEDDPKTADVDEAMTTYKKDDVIPIECATGNADASRSKLVVTEPTIVAKLKNGPLWLQIFDGPANEAGLVDAIENDEDGDNDAESDDTPNDVHTELGGMGITVGYTTDDLGVALGITSDEDFDAGTPEDGSFAISADLKVNVGPADLQLQVVQGLKAEADKDEDADDTGVGALLKTTFGNVTLSGGADLVMTGDENVDGTPEDESMQFEVGVGADVKLAEIMDADGMVVSSTMFGADYIYSSVQKVASDVEVIFKDTGGLVDRLSMGLTWGLFDLNNGSAADDAADTENDSMDMFVKGDLSYALDAMGGKLKPGAELVLNQVDGGDSTLGLTVMAVLTEAVPATEFGLQWKTDQVFDVGDTMAKSGTVTAWAKIKYS